MGLLPIVDVESEGAGNVSQIIQSQNRNQQPTYIKKPVSQTRHTERVNSTKEYFY